MFDKNQFFDDYLEMKKAFIVFNKYYNRRRKRLNKSLNEEQIKTLTNLLRFWENDMNLEKSGDLVINIEVLSHFHESIRLITKFQEPGHPWVEYDRLSNRFIKLFRRCGESSLLGGTPVTFEFRREVDINDAKDVLKELNYADDISPISDYFSEMILIHDDFMEILGAAFIASMDFDPEGLYKKPHRLDYIYIRDDRRREGLGSKLLNAASEKYELVCIVTDNELIPFYNKNGYKLVSNTAFPFPSYYKVSLTSEKN